MIGGVYGSAFCSGLDWFVRTQFVVVVVLPVPVTSGQAAQTDLTFPSDGSLRPMKATRIKPVVSGILGWAINDVPFFAHIDTV